MGVSRQQRGHTGPCLFDVLKNDQGLRDGLASMNKHGDLLVNRILLQQELALAREVFFYVPVIYTLELQSPHHSGAVCTCPETVELHFFGHQFLTAVTHRSWSAGRIEGKRGGGADVFD